MYIFDDNPPQYPSQYYTVNPQRAERVKDDYRWLENYLPYSDIDRSVVHWFIRFK